MTAPDWQQTGPSDEGLVRCLHAALEGGARACPFAHMPYAALPGAAASVGELLLADAIAVFASVSRTGGLRAALIVCHLPWDSEFFGQPVYALRVLAPSDDVVDPDDWREGLARAMDLVRERAPGAHVSCRVYPDNAGLLAALPDSGFWLVDTQLHMIARRADLNDIRPGAAVIRLNDAARHGPLVEAFARTCAFPSRLSRDAFFDPARVAEMNHRWLRQLCFDENGVAFGVLSQGRLAGFAGGQLMTEPAGNGTRQFVSRILAGSVPGKGAQGFYAMSRLGATVAKQAAYVEAVISVANTGALRMVERLGYRTFAASHCFHFRPVSATPPPAR